MTGPLHGSNPYNAYHFMNIPMPDDYLDFSVNINPFGPPDAIQRHWSDWLSAVYDYPDPDGKELTGKIAEKEGLSAAHVLLGNGASELITLIAQQFSGKNVLLIQPTFSEYEQACRVQGCHVSSLVLTENDWQLPFAMLAERLPDQDVLFLCHPNNPTGITYSQETLNHLRQMCADNKCMLVIDEAFYDFCEQPVSLVDWVHSQAHVIILRSLTKMYAIAGVRLGYVLAPPEVIGKLRRYQPHWSVNALAQLAGRDCLRADAHVRATQQYIAKESSRMQASLREAGYRVSNSRVNFYLLRDPMLDEQWPLYRFLLECGLIPRHTANFPGLDGKWLRFSLKQTQENNRLLEALWSWKNKT